MELMVLAGKGDWDWWREDKRDLWREEKRDLRGDYCFYCTTKDRCSCPYPS